MRDPRMHRCVARTIEMLIHEVCSFGIGLSWFLGEASCMTLQYYHGFLSITPSHETTKWRQVTALVQEGLEVFFILFTLMGNKDCVRFPFRNRSFLISWRGFLQGFKVTASVQAGLQVYLLLLRSWIRRTASKLRRMLDGASIFVLCTSRMQWVWCFQLFTIRGSPCSSVGVTKIQCLVLSRALKSRICTLWVGSKPFNAVHPVFCFPCDPTVSFSDFTYDAAEIACTGFYLLIDDSGKYL